MKCKKIFVVNNRQEDWHLRQQSENIKQEKWCPQGLISTVASVQVRDQENVFVQGTPHPVCLSLWLWLLVAYLLLQPTSDRQNIQSEIKPFM